MIVGTYDVGINIFEMARDTKRVARLTFDRDGLLPDLRVLVDGLGSGSGDVLARPIVYNAAGDLLGSGDEVGLSDNAPTEWITFPFSEPPAYEAGDLDVGLHVGGAGTNVLRMFGDALTAGSGTGTDTYADGPSDPFGTRTTVNTGLSLFTQPFDEYVPSPDETDLYYGRLPWLLSQQVLGQNPAGVSDFRPQSATVQWHGTRLDGERGAFALVRNDSVFRDLVGHRISLTNQNRRVVYVWVLGASTLIDSDFSLSRRAFLALDGPYKDQLNCVIRKLS